MEEQKEQKEKKINNWNIEISYTDGTYETVNDEPGKIAKLGTLMKSLTPVIKAWLFSQPKVKELTRNLSLQRTEEEEYDKNINKINGEVFNKVFKNRTSKRIPIHHAKEQQKVYMISKWGLGYITYWKRYGGEERTAEELMKHQYSKNFEWDEMEKHLPMFMEQLKNHANKKLNKIGEDLEKFAAIIKPHERNKEYKLQIPINNEYDSVPIETFTIKHGRVELGNRTIYEDQIKYYLLIEGQYENILQTVKDETERLKQVNKEYGQNFTKLQDTFKTRLVAGLL